MAEQPNPKQQAEANQKLHNRVYAGGSEEAVTRHRQRGKWTARERIAYLLDPETPFLEIGALAGHELYDHSLPAAGLIAGVGYVQGHAMVVIANDATVKAGCYFPITVKKHLRALDVATQLGLSIVHLVDSGGAYLPLQHEVFPDASGFGRIFYQQARLSKRGLRQFAVVMGHCTAGGSYIPAMCDEIIMVRGQGNMALAGPSLVKAATGEDVSAEALGGAQMHNQVSGVADYLADDDQQALDIIKRRFGGGENSAQNALNLAEIMSLPAQPEVYDLIPEDPRHVMAADQLIALIADPDSVDYFKAGYGVTLLTAFAEIAGRRVGIIANQGVLMSESALKATQFIQLCEREGRPLIFLHNVTGFMVGSQSERQGIIKHGAKMVMAVANAVVPKVSVVIGGSYGAGHYAMCGRAFAPDFLWTWPNARVAVMGGEQAGFVMEKLGRSEAELSGLRQDYDESAEAVYGSARLWDDGVIDPAHTRRVLAWSLAAIAAGQREGSAEGCWGLFRH